MSDAENRAREYIAKHSEYSEVFGQTFVAVDTLTAMVGFAEQETKELEQKLEQTEKDLADYQFNYPTIKELQKENAELEETLGKCAKMPVLYCLGAKETITKAKEIIKKLYPFVRDKCYTTTLSENKERQSLITEAEQFLKESE